MIGRGPLQPHPGSERRAPLSAATFGVRRVTRRRSFSSLIVFAIVAMTLIVSTFAGGGASVSIAEDNGTVPDLSSTVAMPGSPGLEVRNMTPGNGISVIGAAFSEFLWQTVSGGTLTRSYQYDALNKLTAIHGAEESVYHYDISDRLARIVKNDGSSTSYTYDRLDRLIGATVQPPGPQLPNNSTYTYYGPTWMRASATVGGVSISYLHDGFACVAQTTGGVTTNYFVPGSKPLWERTGSTSLTYTDDGRGNVTGLWNGTAYANKFQYDAFGNVKTLDGAGQPVANSSGPRFGGQFYDAATDQIYLRNRYYSPGTGRFNVMDPAGTSGGWNLYGYCGGDPVNATDPMGTEWHIFKSAEDAEKGDPYKRARVKAVQDFRTGLYIRWYGTAPADMSSLDLELDMAVGYFQANPNDRAFSASALDPKVAEAFALAGGKTVTDYALNRANENRISETRAKFLCG